MTEPEIPLLRESAAFARRLREAARRHSASRYHFHRRVNWSYRHGSTFYEAESRHFRDSPDGYLAGDCNAPPQVEDVYGLRLGARQLMVAVLKVAAHRLFRVLGIAWRRALPGAPATTYRKAYVDDIELVFDPDERGVLRAIYPFPINVRRQLRYLSFVRARGYAYGLAGIPYGMADLLRLVARRDVRSLQQLESRGQLRHALEVARDGFSRVQLSDEFEIGSLDFVRRLNRIGVPVVNSAHGVGMYFPVHAYPRFQVVTSRQAEYYHSVGECIYEHRRLNDRAGPVTDGPVGLEHESGAVSRVVFLSQSFIGVSQIVSRSETEILARVAQAHGGASPVELYYRPHPNCHEPVVPAGFKLLPDLALVNGKPGTVFVSFYSTCQVDPAFKGRKFLLRTQLIHPEIAFDEDEEVIDAAGFIGIASKGHIGATSPVAAWHVPGAVRA